MSPPRLHRRRHLLQDPLDHLEIYNRSQELAVMNKNLFLLVKQLYD